MPASAVALIALLAAGIAALRLGQLSRMRRQALLRAGMHAEAVTGEPFVEAEPVEVVPFPRRYHLAGPIAAIAIACGVHFLTRLPDPYAIAFGILAGVFFHLAEVRWSDMRVEKIEQQLVDALDQMVASLRAGSALLGALEVSSREARSPIREEFEYLVGRIRIGDDPREAIRDLQVRVPLESFRLFSFSLLVHWETGGSLASSLRGVGRTVRDRLEVSRRINAQAVESQVSVAAVMFIAYAVTLLTFVSNPGPITKLVFSVVGSYAAAGVITLQAIGMFWIWNMSRIRF